MAAERTPHANYLLHCSGCHGSDGMGSNIGGVPPFPGFIASFASDPEGRVYLLHVPGVVASGLDDGEIARVLNYIVDRWDGANQVAPFTSSEVADLRRATVNDIVSYRRAIVKRFQEKGMPVAEYPWP
ncbi:hypothetical protein IB238_22695 [Rhizobium sp. ARZ01]|uniref:c-type cytochrome n=1 Tax=Rhizobium sp. ARZ01 TaxID=2769313 RepID=UPI00177F11F7|nr:cytochrome c [Rhizobium sp. ARZ01]MBD9375432.1 hypothetical protein [Rhizobium sp. ARZ01]